MTEGGVRDGILNAIPYIVGYAFVLTLAIFLIAKLQEGIGGLIREPLLLLPPVAAFGIVGFIAFLAGASIGLAAIIGGAAGVLLLLVFIFA